MSRWLIACLVLCALHAPQAMAGKDNGLVAHMDSGCDFIVVQTHYAWALVQWYGGARPNDGDILLGEFGSYRMQTMYNRTRQANVEVLADRYWLTEDEAFARYADQCRKESR